MSDMGVFISSRWIIGAGHQNQGSAPPPQYLGQPISVRIPKQQILGGSAAPGYFSYTFYATDTIEPGDLAVDVRMLKLANLGTKSSNETDPLAPNQIDLDNLGHRFFRLGAAPLNGNSITVGGFGNTAYETPAGTLDFLEPTRGLRWGRGRINISGALAGLVSASTQSQTGYVKYDAQLGGGDSGSGHYFRRGLEWEVAGIVSAGGTLSPGLSVESMMGNIQAALQTHDPAAIVSMNSLSLAAAQPTRYWDGSSDNSWNTAGYNWTDTNGAYSAPPRYDSAVADSVLIYTAAGPNISGTAVAQDVFISKGGQTAASASMSSGSLTVAGLFLAHQPSQKGSFAMSGGNLKSQQTYLGLKGVGTFTQTGGVHKVELLSLGGTAASGVASYYSLQGGTLNAGDTAIGVNSTGDVELQVGGTSTFTSERLQVGDGGVGIFSQAGGETIVHEATISSGSRLTLFAGEFVARTATVAGSIDALGGSMAIGQLKSATGSALDFQSAGTSITFETGLVDLSEATFSNYGPGASIRVNNALVTVSPAAGALLNNGVAVRDNQGNLVTDLSSIPIHVVGSPAVIRNGNAVIGFGEISDRVEVSEGASLTPGAYYWNNGISSTQSAYLILTGGVKLDDESSIDLGANQASRLTVTAGRQFAAQTSVINTGAISPTGPQGTFTAQNIEVSSNGKLVASGERFIQASRGSSLINAGQFEIGTSGDGNEVASLRLGVRNSTTAKSGLTSYGVGSVMVFDVTATGHDKLEATRIHLGGQGYGGSEVPQAERSVIQIDVPASDVSSFQLGDSFTLVDLDENANGQLDSDGFREVIFGYYRNVRYGGDSDLTGLLEPAQSGIATLQSFMNPDGNPATHDGKAIAIVYADQFVGTGPFVGDAIIDPSMGVSAVIAIPGDANLDGIVDQLDFSVVANHFNGTGTWADGDFNGDGLVNQLDYSTVASYWGQSDDYGVGIGGVPEPAASTLLLTSLAAVAARRRRRK
ncbi:MAG: hypothetical protein JNL18_07600 [Planctomycetaceae bacterium]|nr:hypothetical protein [Planctomycetaceae bacterium]